MIAVKRDVYNEYVFIIIIIPSRQTCASTVKRQKKTWTPHKVKLKHMSVFQCIRFTAMLIKKFKFETNLSPPIQARYVNRKRKADGFLSS